MVVLIYASLIVRNAASACVVIHCVADRKTSQLVAARCHLLQYQISPARANFLCDHGSLMKCCIECIMCQSSIKSVLKFRVTTLVEAAISQG